jgi:5-methyltetrahydrofolate--homocysteine methyltransferase
MFDDLYGAVITGDANKVIELTQKELKSGAEPSRLIEKCLLPAISNVGKRFECDEYFVPELLIAARALRCGLDTIRPAMLEQNDPIEGRVVVGAVQGELHDIGVVLIERLLEGVGITAVNLGVDVSPEKFVQAIRKEKIKVLALSASNTTVKSQLKRTLDALKKADLRQKTKVMVGGPFITQEHADKIGADGYSDNVMGAVRLAREWLNK